MSKRLLGFSTALLFVKPLKYPILYVIILNIESFSLDIEVGNTIGIIGPSGSGKSTIINLFLGLLEPQSGNIKVDNFSIKKNYKSWQQNIGYVPQNIYLTDDSFLSNIAFGEKEDKIDLKRVKEIIKDVKLDDYINNLPNGLNTYLGERGVRLSGGQLQRIGIARALYNDPPVLVLDEATSSLDMETEEKIMKAVNSLQSKKNNHYNCT